MSRKIFKKLNFHLKQKLNLSRENSLTLPIPLITQEENLTCEAACIRMVLAHFDQIVAEDTIQQRFSKNANPHLGFRGNFKGPIWGFDDYGAYAKPVADVLQSFAIRATPVTNLEVAKLKNHILSGLPALIWVNLANPKPQIKTEMIKGVKVKLITGQHVVVVTGFQNGFWVVNDPWRITDKNNKRISQKLLVEDLDKIMWADFEHMAVLITGK
jgi:uncharacterized protein YvpB